MTARSTFPLDVEIGLWQEVTKVRRGNLVCEGGILARLVMPFSARDCIGLDGGVLLRKEAWLAACDSARVLLPGLAIGRGWFWRGPRGPAILRLFLSADVGYVMGNA